MPALPTTGAHTRWTIALTPGDATGRWPLTDVGEDRGDGVAADVLGEPRPADTGAVPGAADTATSTRACAGSDVHLTLLGDGGRLTGGHALGAGAPR